MKPSIYNFVFDNGSNYLLYNAASDEIIVMGEELYKLYTENLNDIANIQCHHPKFYDYLLSKGAIVDDSCSESDSVIARWKANEVNANTFTITINPTMDCNMSCWYCYEKRNVKTKMDQTVADSVLALIKNICVSVNDYETILLSFFGGEPMLYFDEIVFPLIEKALEICKANGKKLRTHFTTNGFLVSKERLEKMGKMSIPLSFQITLDGNSAVHDKNKVVIGSGGTYQRTVSNIKVCLEMGALVIVRLNFTEASLPYFIDVLTDFSDVDVRLKEKMSFNFQRIWQDSSTISDEDLRMQVRNMEKAFGDQGFRIAPYSSNTFGRCYADMENSIVVNYDGNVFKCTAREFIPQNREGIICADGNIHWDNKHSDRKQIAYGNDNCQKCRVFPLCHGGCSQCKLESENGGKGCLKGLSASEKLQLVQNRIQDILLLYNCQSKMKKV
ncbi:radical SAM protein [Segatella hominis]|uniref:radical SAM protein n=1 Tax=Segatella hominis TaxID=2518605 RepID=UPI003F81F719